MVRAVDCPSVSAWAGLVQQKSSSRQTTCCWTMLQAKCHPCTCYSTVFCVNTEHAGLTPRLICHRVLSFRPRKKSESTPAHGTVAAAVAVSHRHHLIICVGADPIKFVYSLYLPLATVERILNEILFPVFLWQTIQPVPWKMRLTARPNQSFMFP